MPNVSNSSRNTTVLLVIILAGESIFLLPFVLARIFRPTLLRVFEITNFELGTAFSAYGIVAMLSYFFGGPLADRFPARNLMALALWATAIGGLVMSFIPSSKVLILLYAYWGFTTIFLFWAAMIRATREWGGTGFQGRAFGFLEGGRGLIAAIIATIALLFFSWISTEDNMSSNGIEGNTSFQKVILLASLIVFISGVLVKVFVPLTIHQTKTKLRSTSLDEVIKLAKMPAIWMQAIIIISAYIGYKITDDYSLYAHQVLGMDEIKAAGVGSVALWMRPVFAVMAGFLADRYRGSRIVVLSFLIMLLSGTIIYIGDLENNIWPTLIIMSTTLIGVYGIRSIYFALMQESGIPIVATGTAVGIMSVVGFTPDVFMSPLMGYLLDTYPGAQGHQYVFLALAVSSTLGLIVSYLFNNHISQKKVDKQTAI